MSWCSCASRCRDSDDVWEWSAAPSSSVCWLPFVFLVGCPRVTPLCRDGGAIHPRQTRLQLFAVTALLLLALLSSGMPAHQAAPAIGGRMEAAGAAAGAPYSDPMLQLTCAAASPRWRMPVLLTARRFLLLRRTGHFFMARCPYYANAVATQQSSRLQLLTSGDVESNPGPESMLRVCCQNVCGLNNKHGTLRSHALELSSYDALA